MKYTSILEKLECIFKLISSSVMYPIFLLFLTLLIVLLVTKKLKDKKGIILIIISYIILSIIVIKNNYIRLGKVFDDISTSLFTNIYFPSAYTYFFILIIIDIITIKSLLNFKEEKVYKITNSIFFFTIQFIFILIMDLVGKNNIDIFVKKSLFSNKNLVILLESSINIFILWLVSLLIIYITNKIVEIIKNHNTVKEEIYVADNINNTLVIDNIPENDISTSTEDNNNEAIKENIYETTNSQENVTTYNDYAKINIPVYSNYEENINTTPVSINLENNELETKTNEDIITNTTIGDTFSLNDLIFSKQNTLLDNAPTAAENTQELLEQFLNNDIPVLHEKEEIIEKKETYTLNDYRIFNKILKDIRETNKSNIININKELELKLISKYPKDEYNLFKLMLKEYSN